MMAMSKNSPQKLACRRIQAYRAKAVDDAPSAYPKKDCKKNQKAFPYNEYRTLRVRYSLRIRPETG